MFWWSIMASACRSASKRAMTWRLSMPGLMILSATRAADRLGLLGHVDDAHAPLADLLEELVRADDGTGAFVDRLKIGGRIQECGTALEKPSAGSCALSNRSIRAASVHHRRTPGRDRRPARRHRPFPAPR